MSYSIKNTVIVEQSNKEMLWEILKEKAHEDLNLNINRHGDINLFFNSIIYRIHDDRFSFRNGLNEMNRTLIKECYKYILQYNNRLLENRSKAGQRVIENQKFPQNSRKNGNFTFNEETSNTIHNRAPISIGTQKQNILDYNQKMYENKMLERDKITGRPEEIDFSLESDINFPKVDSLMEESMKKREHELEMITRGYAQAPKRSSKHEKPVKKERYDKYGNMLLNLENSRDINIENETKPLKSILNVKKNNKNNKNFKNIKIIDGEKEIAKNVTFNIENELNIDSLLNKFKTVSEKKDEKVQMVIETTETNIEKSEELEIIKFEHNQMKNDIAFIKDSIQEIFKIIRNNGNHSNNKESNEKISNVK